MLFLKEYLKVVVMVERFVGLEEARPVLGQLAEEAATGDEVWLTKHGKPMAVLLSREAYLQLRQAAARAGREELAARVAEARRKVAEAGLDPAIVDEAVEAARRSACAPDDSARSTRLRSGNQALEARSLPDRRRRGGHHRGPLHPEAPPAIRRLRGPPYGGGIQRGPASARQAATALSAKLS
jgi:prevent-host-death family protein